MKVSVIIVNYNVRYFLEVCLHSVARALQRTTGEIIVVDNNSTDESIKMIRNRFPSVTVIENKENKGFGKANNQGVTIAQGEYILFLNPDTVLPEDFFEKAITYMDAHPEAGCLGPKLLDGKGQFAPESKRSFPTLFVALYKTTGINKLFSHSPYFNRYYAVHIGEDETAPVDVLMGCCMLLRTAILDKIQIAFDEDFFMYGEDIDLSYRIQKAGYENIYFPETSIIHYKGESTKKSTLSYVKTFNEALSLFVKKNYPTSKARLFSGFINLGIMARAAITLFKNALSAIKMPLLDALFLLGMLWAVKELYLIDIKGYSFIPTSALLATMPAYLAFWLGSMYLNGVYEPSYNPTRVIRGMTIGTILALAYYGLLSYPNRYSRSIILFTGFAGTIMLLALHQIFHHFRILKYIPYSKISRKTVVVADEKGYEDTAKLMQETNYPLHLFGRIATDDSFKENAIASANQIAETIYQANIQEVIFCTDTVSYNEVFKLMQQCGKDYEYKIHLSGSKGFVGSNSRHTSGDIYITAPKFHLSHNYHVRNKRIFDILFSLLLLLMFPVILFSRSSGQLIKNIFEVLKGKKTWVGYATTLHSERLPVIKPSILPAYHIFSTKQQLKLQALDKLDSEYATNYNVLSDVRLVFKNFKFLSENPEKYFAEK